MKKRVLYCVFGIYVVVLLMLTVFRTRSYPIEGTVNLSLFTDLVATYHENGIWMVLYLVGGNIVWFVPFGLFSPMIWKKLRGLFVILLGLCFSLAIETGQLLLGTGLFEIDDLVLNTLGTAIGCLIYKIYRDFRK